MGKREGWRVRPPQGAQLTQFSPQHSVSWAQWHVARQLWTITRHLGFWVPFGVAAEAVIARATRIASGESGLPPEQRAIVRRVQVDGDAGRDTGCSTCEHSNLAFVA